MLNKSTRKYYWAVIKIKFRCWKALRALDLVKLAGWFSKDAVEKFAFQYAQMNPSKFWDWKEKNL